PYEGEGSPGHGELHAGHRLIAQGEPMDRGVGPELGLEHPDPTASDADVGAAPSAARQVRESDGERLPFDADIFDEAVLIAGHVDDVCVRVVTGTDPEPAQLCAVMAHRLNLAVV